MTIMPAIHRILSWRLFARREEIVTRIDIIKWWELRRIPFNLLVGATGVMTCATTLAVSAIASEQFGEPLGLPDPPIVAIFAVLAYGIAANLCYTGGWIIELFVAKVWKEKAGAFGQITFFLGAIFSVLLTLLPAVLFSGLLVIRILLPSAIVCSTSDSFGKNIVIPPGMVVEDPQTIPSEHSLSEGLVPHDSIRNGQPDIELVNGMQGGIYHVYAYANPAESGEAYLKVFEATKSISLSSERIRPRSVQAMRGSANPQETFLYHSEITVYEGDWGNFYPARFELWFQPASGGPERKLVEKIFRIQGWER